MTEKKSKYELLQEKIFLKKESSWKKITDTNKVFSFAEDYKSFLKNAKTERLAVKELIKILEKTGFNDMNKVKSAKTGDKLYKNIKDKTLIAFIVGKDTGKFNIVASHIDSPRLDLKPSPLYEDSGLALLKTHYYGGIKKYHWVNTPLALIGVIFTKQGKKIEIEIGNKKDDPVFIIPDLLPHLAHDQMEKNAKKVVEGEDLNIIIGNIPFNDETIKEQIKFNILKKLNDDYGMIEEDFITAELELVPANNPIDVGLDRSMIAAYGQDDKVCAYASTIALTEIKTPKTTAVSMFFDKEETGSMGDVGAESFILHNFAIDYIEITGIKINPSKLLESSMALSADVTAGQDPNFKDVNDAQNVSYLGHGVSIEKYGGGGGKYHTNDAHAEYFSYIRTILDKNSIPWQTGELGKIDIGGGGTIAMFLSRYGMDCIDAGPCVLGMHSTYEVTCKADIYNSYKLYKQFLKEK